MFPLPRCPSTVEEEKERAERFTLGEVTLDHPTPFVLHCQWHLRVAVSREVAERVPLIDKEEVEQLRASWCPAHASELFLIKKAINQA